ncbi:hypothetical protein DL546_007896 [Coniochaeta pulveracea]|uniref:Ig-like domain-containing protein n=1 Tax=Coniochaeta pulveracea TaxID=177199 RepID=A0A420YGM6_9PEZI|nr:hypothetical protein DL546_007896 [Coniochaeta pulveracea]
MLKGTGLLAFGVAFASGSPVFSPGNTNMSPKPTLLSAVQEAGYCMEAWSTTETHTTKLQWSDPTAVTWIASRSLTTLEQLATTYPATLTDTLVSTATYEYHMTYADHHTEESYSCAVYTIPLNTRVVDVAPATTQQCLMSSSPTNRASTRSLACVQMYP